jgi:hypothetical protein
MQHRTPLDDIGLELIDDIHALLDEHLPATVAATVKDKIEALQENCWAEGDDVAKATFRALMGLIPHHFEDIHAAFSATSFAGSVCTEREIVRWAANLEELPTLEETLVHLKLLGA